MKKTRYLSLGSPSGFIEFFGKQANKQYLINFLNQLLPDAKVIHDLAYEEITPSRPEDGLESAAISLVCDIGEEHKCLVDLQLPDKTNYPDWSVGSLSSLICRYSHKLLEEDPGAWIDYGIRNTNMIAILPFTDPHAPKGRYFSHAQFKDKKTGAIFTDILAFTVIQLPNFRKTGDELETDLDRWLYLFRSKDLPEPVPSALNCGIFPEVLQAVATA